jgi:hypothetical protein
MTPTNEPGTKNAWKTEGSYRSNSEKYNFNNGKVK